MSLTSVPHATASRSILGPLTTTFTPGAVCGTLGALENAATVNSFFQSARCSSGDLIDNTSCWPSASTSLPASVFNNFGNVNGLGLYSPGLHCPVGYATACMQELDSAGRDRQPTGASSTSFLFPLIPNETAVGCCPSGFACGVNQSGYQSCVSTASSTAITAATCGTNAYSGQNTYKFPVTTRVLASGSRTTQRTVSDATIYAPLIQLAYQSSDMASATPSTNSSGSGKQGGSKTSGGAIAGAIVGAVAVLASVVAAIVLFLRRRRMSRNLHHNSQDHTMDQLPGYSSNDGYYAVAKKEGGSEYLRSELDGRQARAEAPDTNEIRPELVGSGMTHELPGDVPSRSR